jgi:hypothetical protein
VSFLLVNDDDGRILAVFETIDEAARALDEAGSQDSPTRLAVVAFHEAPGSVLGTEASVTMRPLS